VSYFDGSRRKATRNFQIPIKESPIYSALWSISISFKANPEKYEPAYGGWCAYAMGENGEKVKIDPETYKIIEGKLFLFYNFWAITP